jgi:hypothetical protein
MKQRRRASDARRFFVDTKLRKWFNYFGPVRCHSKVRRCFVEPEASIYRLRVLVPNNRKLSRRVLGYREADSQEQAEKLFGLVRVPTRNPTVYKLTFPGCDTQIIVEKCTRIPDRAALRRMVESILLENVVTSI